MLDAHVLEEGLDLLIVRGAELLRQLLHALQGVARYKLRIWKQKDFETGFSLYRLQGLKPGGFKLTGQLNATCTCTAPHLGRVRVLVVNLRQLLNHLCSRAPSERRGKHSFFQFEVCLK